MEQNNTLLAIRCMAYAVSFGCVILFLIILVCSMPYGYVITLDFNRIGEAGIEFFILIIGLIAMLMEYDRTKPGGEQ